MPRGVARFAFFLLLAFPLERGNALAQGGPLGNPTNDAPRRRRGWVSVSQRL
jgi:hypothetical protein